MAFAGTTYFKYPSLKNQSTSGVNTEIIGLGNALNEILQAVNATENFAKQNQAEEEKLVSLLLNCIQWLKGSIGSYEQLSLSSLAANMRGMYECHVTLAFLMMRTKGSAQNYLEKYDKFRYAEKYRMLTEQEKEKNGKIQTEYNKYAKLFFQRKKEKIHKEWTGEGFSVLDLSRLAGFDQFDYNEYYKQPAVYMRNSSLIRELYNTKSEDALNEYTLKCETLTLYVFQHCMQIIKKYTDYFQKNLPAWKINHWIKSFRTIARNYQND